MRALALLTVAALTAVPAYAWIQTEAPAAETETKAKGVGNVDDENRVRCRAVEVTGSLVKRGRVCRTIREWRAIAEAGNYNARKMIEESTSKQMSN